MQSRRISQKYCRTPKKVPLEGFRRAWASACLICLCLLWTPAARAELALDKLRAAFAYKFALFVEWPFEKQASVDKRPFQFCVRGDDHFKTAVREVIGSRPIRGRAIEVSRVLGPSDARACDLLLFDQNAAGDQILNEVKNLTVLTISGAPGFNTRGGIIELFWIDGRLQFSINRDAASAVDLYVRSRLLNLAQRRSEKASQ